MGMTKKSITAQGHQEAIVHNGKPGILMSCDCKQHEGYGNKAIMVRGITEMHADRIHGFVLLANHPAKMMRQANARTGLFPA